MKNVNSGRKDAVNGVCINSFRFICATNTLPRFANLFQQAVRWIGVSRSIPESGPRFEDALFRDKPVRENRERCYGSGRTRTRRKAATLKPHCLRTGRIQVTSCVFNDKKPELHPMQRASLHKRYSEANDVGRLAMDFTTMLPDYLSNR